MPHPCVVCGRSRMNPNNREEEYVFFGFPVNDEVRCQKWLEFCCREDLYKLTKKQLLQRMVCSKHFQPKDFLNEYLDRLNCSAVPSIYDPKQSLYNISCVLCGRARSDPPGSDYDGATFHHFPGEEFRCLKWLDFVGVNSYYRLTRKEILFCYICSKHFDSSQFMNGFRSRLVDNAVPNIKYPDQSDEIECVIEAAPELKFVGVVEKPKKLDPLTPEILESQACAACGRMRSDPRNKAEKYKFHPFPAYEIGRCLKWCQFLGREDLLKMSPNQIRKLVLCSKHFEAGQSFHKIGPCDAVPTILDPTDYREAPTEEEDIEEKMIEECNVMKKKKRGRPLVSSKKPKVDNKPAPLAKKRGKSRRPTSINIPRPDPNNIENRLKKLPLPPSNWKLLSNQFQPITIANNIASNVANNVSTDIKKVILPFTGDITNLGAPIPVHSLSSIPPGLLIKINLPNQNKKPAKTGKRQTRSKKEKVLKVQEVEKMESVNNQIDLEEQTSSNIMSDLITFPNEHDGELISGDLEVQEEIELSDTLIKHEEFATDMDVEQYYEVQQPKRKPKLKKRITPRTRRTIFPITCELRAFLRKLKPHMHKLPKKAKAQVKLSIVNKVIDHL